MIGNLPNLRLLQIKEDYRTNQVRRAELDGGHWLNVAAEEVKIEVFNFADLQLSIVPKEFIDPMPPMHVKAN